MWESERESSHSKLSALINRSLEVKVSTEATQASWLSTERNRWVGQDIFRAYVCSVPLNVPGLQCLPTDLCWLFLFIEKTK